MSVLNIAQRIQQSIETKQAVLADTALLGCIEEVSTVMVSAFRQDHKVWFCGNGGSAADAQHLSAELSGRFYFDRPPLFSEALHVNSSYLTAVANDYAYDEVYARLVRGFGRPGDILVGLSTSGNSKNIVRAFEAAAEKNMITVGLTGQSGGAMKSLATHWIGVPSTDTPRIQESHIMIGHIICEWVEEALFGKPAA